MQQDSQRGKRIARNTIILYCRMLLLMAITLYTSRVVLQALGVNDFGIYNVVGGFVSTFAIVCNALSGASSRFLNYEMGRNCSQRLNLVFSSSLTIHIFLAIIIILLVETFGLWFLDNKIVIPAERLHAAHWCFHLSAITFCMQLLVVPYRATIIAHERMSAFAYVSIFEGVGKLVVAILLFFSAVDKLILYAVLLFTIQFSVNALYFLYCFKKFSECKYHFFWDWELLKQLLVYSGWNFFGHASAILRNQGGNVLTNLFFGPTVNAARGIANQVLHAVLGFVTNFTLAVNPQINQSYAAGDIEYMKKLVYTSARFSFYLLFLLSLPIILSSNYILNIWLKEPPLYADLFVQLMLIFSLIDSVNAPIQEAQAATGNIKVFQLTIGLFQILILPISYIILKMGGGPATVLYVSIVIGLLGIYLRLFLLRQLIPWDIWDYTKKVLFKVIFVIMASLPLPLFVNNINEESCFLKFLTISLVSILSSLATIWLVGLTSQERCIVVNRFQKYMRK